MQVDSDPFLDDVPGYLSVATSGDLDGYSLTGGMRFLALHSLLLVGIRRL